MPFECNKCEDLIKDGERMLVLTAAHADGEDDYARDEDVAYIHECCDDGLSLTLPADRDDWLGDPEPCEHMRQHFNIP